MLPSSDWVGVTTPNTVYVGITDRAEFDKIALRVAEHAPLENGERCLSKIVEDRTTGVMVMVIFQHWIAP